LSKEREAEIIPFPSLMEIGFNCGVCHRAGQGLIYKCRYESMKKAIMYCETCRLLNENSININLNEAQELIGVPVFPTGVIEWENLRPVMK